MPTNKCKLNYRNSPFCYSQCITDLDSYHPQMSKLLGYYLLGNVLKNAPSPCIPDGTWIHRPILEPLNVSHQLMYWLWPDATESVSHLPLSYTHMMNWNLGQDTSTLPNRRNMKIGKMTLTRKQSDKYRWLTKNSVSPKSECKR